MQYSFPIFEETSFREDMEKMYANPRAAHADGAWLVCFNMVMLFGMYGKVCHHLLLPPLSPSDKHANIPRPSSSPPPSALPSTLKQSPKPAPPFTTPGLRSTTLKST